MKKKAARVFSAIYLIALVITLTSSVTASAKDNLPNHTRDFYVNDFAGVLSSSTYNEIFNLSLGLDNASGAQIVVATIDTTNGTAMATYATKLAREWGIGDAYEDNGVLILLAVKDREVYIAIGRGLEGILPDGKTGRLIREYGKPYYKDNEFDTGTLELYKAVYSVVAEDYGLSILDGYESAVQDGPVISTGYRVLLIVITIAIIIIFISTKPSGNSGGNSGGGWYDYDSDCDSSYWGSSDDSGDSGGFSGGGGDFSGGGAGSSF